MVNFKHVLDDGDDDDLEDVLEDVRGYSISLTKIQYVDPAPSDKAWKLKTPARKPHHPWPLEQLLHNLSSVW